MLYHINNAKHFATEKLCCQGEHLIRAIAAASIPWSLVRNGSDIDGKGHSSHCFAMSSFNEQGSSSPVMSVLTVMCPLECRRRPIRKMEGGS